MQKTLFLIHCFSLVFTRSVSSTFHAFWLAPITRNILGYSLFCIQSQDGFSLWDMFGNLSNKWSSHANKIVPRKRPTLACRCLLVEFIIFILNLQQNRKNALDKIPEMFVNCKLSSYQVTFVIYKKLLFSFFFPTDLVNTKTTIPLRVGEQH